MIDNCCCFTGHRNLDVYDAVIRQNIKSEVLNLISKGVDTFFCGGAVGFDTLCGKIIIEFKKFFPSIKLKLALPCPQQDKYFNQEQKDDYELLKRECDEIFYASDHYTSKCMLDRNRFMVDMSKYVICYCRKSSGGTFYTVKYATSLNKEIISL